MGLASASVGASYSRAASQVSSAAANCNVNVSFEALLVTIDRGWLHGELIADQELNTSPEVALSPGPKDVHRYIDLQDQTAMDKYRYFPSYPTSSIVASNVELEFSGDTSKLEEAVESSSLDVQAKV